MPIYWEVCLLHHYPRCQSSDFFDGNIVVLQVIGKKIDVVKTISKSKNFIMEGISKFNCKEDIEFTIDF